MNIKEQVILILEEILHDGSIHKKVENQSNLSFLNLNSITFIKLVIEFENVFNVEFDDDKLDYENFKTLDEVCNYIRSLLQENK